MKFTFHALQVRDFARNRFTAESQRRGAFSFLLLTFPSKLSVGKNIKDVQLQRPIFCFVYTNVINDVIHRYMIQNRT